jgi:predicted nucleic acid-binding protein
VIDTSVLVAGLIPDHELYDTARSHVVAAARGRIPGPVLAEAWAVLRRAPWNLVIPIRGEPEESWLLRLCCCGRLNDGNPRWISDLCSTRGS